MSLAKHSISTVKRLPQMLAVALAVGSLVLPAIPAEATGLSITVGDPEDPIVEVGIDLDEITSAALDGVCSVTNELSVVAAIHGVLKGTTGWNHLLQGRRWMALGPWRASLWGFGISVGATIFDELFCSK